MNRRTLLIAGTLAAIAVASTTPEGREAARERVARWNPLWITLDVIGLIFLLLILFGPRAS